MSATRPMVVGVCGLVLFVLACGSDRETQVAGTTLEGPTLTVRDPVVTVNGTTQDPGPPIPLEPGSDIAADGSGVGIVEYPGLLELELFKGGTVQLPETVTNTAQISLVKGHLHVTADEATGIGTAVDLGARTLTMLEPGTEFVVCQAPDGDTCVYVITGSLRWDGDGDPWTYTAGQGTFARAGEPPASPTCPTQPVLARWLEDALAGQSDQTLSQLIGQYEAGSPCPQGSQNTAPAPETTATGAAVAPGDTEAEPGAGGEDSEAEPGAGGEDSEAEPGAAGALPSGEGMSHVTIEQPTIGTDNPAGTPEHYEERRTISGPIEFYIDERATTNREFRDWLARVAGDDPEVWSARAPTRWLREAPGGAPTQARYPDGERDLPVAGIRPDTAAAYCADQNKRLPTEIEWELAATSGALVDVDEPRQDWVTDWNEYGPVPDGKSVLRGTDQSLRPDPYFRLEITDTAEDDVPRAQAGIRCAADEVQEGTAGPAVGESVVFTDDFCQVTDWPSEGDDRFAIDYHLPCVYHLETRQRHAQVAVIREPEDDLDGRVTVESNVFVLRHEGGPGSFRFGLALGSRDAGYVLFTLQPDLTAQQYEWCIAPMGGDLTQALAASPESYASAVPPVRADRHAGERCAAGLSTGTVDYSDLDDPVRLVMSLEGDSLAAQIDTTQIDPVTWAGPVDSFGFFTETFHMDLAHIHYQDLTATAP